MHFNRLFTTLGLIILLIACTKEVDYTKFNISMMKSTDTISSEKWNALANKKIYIGHQSVGFNIIDGIEMQMAENPEIKLNIKQGNKPIIFNEPVFAHAQNGQNGDPKSKIDTFCKSMDQGLGNEVDVAGFKFCYVDFTPETNVDEIFSYYKKRMNEIILKYPKVKIIHFTSPIRSLQKGPKGFVNKLLGRDIGVEKNMARQKFNTLLASEFKNQAIFDIATYESTYPDGTREFTKVNNEMIYSMVPAYTNDGGHLSNLGKQNLSTKLLLFLIENNNGGNNSKY